MAQSIIIIIIIEFILCNIFEISNTGSSSRFEHVTFGKMHLAWTLCVWIKVHNKNIYFEELYGFCFVTQPLYMMNNQYHFTQTSYGSEVHALDLMSTQTAKWLLDLLAWYMPVPCQRNTLVMNYKQFLAMIVQLRWYF